MESQERKKVLIITYYWPPAGGPGVQRVLKFVKYLPEFGWEPIVLTVRDGEFPNLDNSLLQEATKIKVTKTKALEPFQLYKRLIGKGKDYKIDTYVLNKKDGSWLQKMMQWIRLNLFIPDARIGWYPSAVRVGKSLIVTEKIDLIYSCSPPHSLQLIAKKLASNKNLPWVADFRDPWTDIVFYQGKERSSYAINKDHRLERTVLKAANKIVVTCKGLKKALENKYQFLGEKVSVITNGYDNSDEHLEVDHSTQPKNQIRIFYAGNLSNVRTPKALLKAISDLKKDRLHKNLSFVIAGNIGSEFWKLVEKYKIEGCINHVGYLKYSELKEYFDKATYLLMMVDDTPDNNLFIAGKVFDYLGKKKPILAFGPKNGEVHDIIKETRSGYFFAYKDNQEIYQILKETISNNSIPDHFSFFNIEKYSRKNLTKRLGEVFDNAIQTYSNK